MSLSLVDRVGGSVLVPDAQDSNPYRNHAGNFAGTGKTLNHVSFREKEKLKCPVRLTIFLLRTAIICL